MKVLKQQLGFTLQEVLISLAILTVLGIAAVPTIQKEMQFNLDQEGVASVEQVIASYKQFRSTQRRNPANLNELATLGTYQGNGEMPWGADISFSDFLSSEDGKVKGATFTLQAKDAAQAERMAGMLAKFNPISTGSLLTVSTPISTIETIEDQMLCRDTNLGPEGCNVMQVDLDAGAKNITGAGSFKGNIGDLKTVISDTATIGQFEVSQEIVLGNNSISSNGTAINIQANEISFSGDVSVQGNITGNNSNMTGINRVDANNVTTDTATINEGVVTNLSGVSLEYSTGDFTTVNAQQTTATLGEFETVTSSLINAENVASTTLTSSQGTINNLTASRASGESLNLTGTMNVASLESRTSNIGIASASNLNLTGDSSGQRAIFNLGSFSSLVSTGDITGGDFAGNNFTTSISSVNANKATIDQHATLISRNTSDNNNNKSTLNSLNDDVSLNTSAISLNKSNIVSNKQLAQENATKISQNATAIGVLKTRATSIEAGVATLKSQLETCKSQGGCSW